MDYEIKRDVQAFQRSYFMTTDERDEVSAFLDRPISTDPPPEEDTRRIVASLTLEEAEIIAGVLGSMHSRASMNTYDLYDKMSDAVADMGGDHHNYHLTVETVGKRPHFYVTDRS